MTTDKKTIKIIKKGEDFSNLIFFLELPRIARLEHLEMLRTQYFDLTDRYDSKQGFQRVYSVIRKV